MHRLSLNCDVDIVDLLKQQLQWTYNSNMYYNKQMPLDSLLEKWRQMKKLGKLTTIEANVAVINEKHYPKLLI